MSKDEQLFNPDQPEATEEVDPRLVTDKSKTSHSVRCRNLAEKQEFRDAIEAFRTSRGAESIGDVIPAITSLIEAETAEAPTRISSHVEAVAGALDLVRSEVAAISANFGTVEARERAKAEKTIAGQAEEIERLKDVVKEKDADLVRVRGDAAKLEADLGRARAEAEQLEQRVSDWEERDEVNRHAVKVLTSVLAMPPERQTAAFDELMGR